MKWSYYVKYKVKAALFLALILGAILVGNVLEKNSFSKLDNSIASIYKDRLQVSQYIYEVSNALYQKRLLMDKNVQGENVAQASFDYHNTIINELIVSYEQTVLTKDEKVQWTTFKKQFADYCTMEKQVLSLPVNDSKFVQYNQLLESRFDQTVGTLDALSNIQVGEGYDIQKNSHSIIIDNTLFSYLEISLLIILGLFTLVMLAATDNNIFRHTQNPTLN